MNMHYESFETEDFARNEILNSELNPDAQENIEDVPKLMTGGQAGAIAYGIQRISDIPAVNEKIEDCKEGFKDAFENAKDTVSDFGEKVANGIKDYFCGVYEDIRDFFTREDSVEKHAEWPEFTKLDEGITEGREFGLDKCTDAALEIFNPGVIEGWADMSLSERKDIACLYAEKVAEAFELESYKGVIIEKMAPDVLGSNNGDGYIHISDTLIGDYTTPFLILDTITHELRHQYQSECVNGYHDVTDEVRNEWAMATAIYNYDQPSCYDPWGYSYNPLEIDSNYAGNTVVRNVTSQMFNDVMDQMA